MREVFPPLFDPRRTKLALQSVFPLMLLNLSELCVDMAEVSAMTLVITDVPGWNQMFTVTLFALWFETTCGTGIELLQIASEPIAKVKFVFLDKVPKFPSWSIPRTA